MDPTHPLPATADRTAKPCAENRKHFSECATVGGQNDADAQGHLPNRRRHRLSRCFPALTQARKEVVAWGTRLEKTLVQAGSIEADRRGIHQHLRWRCTGLNRLHQLRGRLQTAGFKQLPVGRGPTFLGNRFPRQVDHRIGLVQGIQQPGIGPGAAAGGVKLHPVQSPIRPFSVVAAGQPAADHRELVPGLEQERQELTANKTSAAKQQQTHERRGGAAGRLRGFVGDWF